MQWMRAQDTFSADLADGTVVRVVKGEPYPDTHELVKRDADAARAAAKAGTERLPLFKPMEDTAPEPPAPRSPAKSAGKAEPKAAAKVTGKDGSS